MILLMVVGDAVSSFFIHFSLDRFTSRRGRGCVEKTLNLFLCNLFEKFDSGSIYAPENSIPRAHARVQASGNSGFLFYHAGKSLMILADVLLPRERAGPSP